MEGIGLLVPTYY